MDNTLEGAVAAADGLYAAHLRDPALDPYHRVLTDFAARCALMRPCRILEIGSREVSGVSRRQSFAGASEYIGLDIHSGPGVDIAGDAHELARIFPANRFDAIFFLLGVRTPGFPVESRDGDEPGPRNRRVVLCVHPSDLAAARVAMGFLAFPTCGIEAAVQRASWFPGSEYRRRNALQAPLAVQRSAYTWGFRIRDVHGSGLDRRKNP